MTNSPTSSDDAPDKEALYKNFLKTERWRDKLARREAYMALDIPDDEMQINVIKRGIGWKELLVIGALIVAGLAVANQFVPQDQEQEFEVRFYNSEGQPIQVPRLPEDRSGD